MILLTVKNSSAKKVDKYLRGLKKEKVPDIMRRAIDNTVRHMQSQVPKGVRKKYLVKAAGVKKTLTLIRPKKDKPEGAIISHANKKLPLYKFKVSPKDPRPLAPPTFYKSQVKKQAGLEKLTGSADRSKGFVARMSSGHFGVFERQLKRRRKNGPGQPLAQLYGPSVPSMVLDKAVSKPLQTHADGYMLEQVKKIAERVMAK